MNGLQYIGGPINKWKILLKEKNTVKMTQRKRDTSKFFNCQAEASGTKKHYRIVHFNCTISNKSIIAPAPTVFACGLPIKPDTKTL